MELELENSKLARYSEYKDSGAEWLGEIPKDWKLKKFKHIFFEKKKTTDEALRCGSISFGKVVYKDDEKIPEATKRSYQVLSKGDFLINPLNLNYDLNSLRIGLSYLDVVVSSGYIIVKNSGQIDKEYYKWLLHIFDIAYMKTLGSGVRQTLSFAHIANSDLVYPSLNEQSVIAGFLNDKTVKIDQAIAIKQKQIDLLKERRQILIHKAVTQGINPDVTLKDSSVKWIGKIPEHWAVVRLKNLGKIKYGLGQPPKEKDGGLPLIRATNVERGKIVEKGLIYVDPEDIPWERDPVLKLDDIIVVRSGAYTGDSAIVTSEYVGSIAGYDIQT